MEEEPGLHSPGIAQSLPEPQIMAEGTSLKYLMNSHSFADLTIRWSPKATCHPGEKSSCPKSNGNRVLGSNP